MHPLENLYDFYAITVKQSPLYFIQNRKMRWSITQVPCLNPTENCSFPLSYFDLKADCPGLNRSSLSIALADEPHQEFVFILVGYVLRHFKFCFCDHQKPVRDFIKKISLQNLLFSIK